MIRKSSYTQHWQKLLLLLNFFFFSQSKCDIENEDLAGRLDAILMDIKTLRYSRDIDDSLKIWQKYEFGTGAGNREELSVDKISIDYEKSLPLTEAKIWEYSIGSNAGTLAGSDGSNLWVCRHGNEDGRVHDRAILTVTGTILTFKVLNLVNAVTNDEEIVAILCVESNSEIKLLFYKYANANFESVWSSIVPRRIQRLDFFQHRGRNRLLLLNEPMNYNGDVYSSIEIYGFNFVGGLLDFWLCQRIWMPEVSGFDICSIYETTFLNLWSGDVVSMYEFRESETKEGLFKLLQNISSNGIKNSLCFENGYTEYLAISGSEPALFTYLENEFVYDEEMEKLMNDLGETLWVQCLPVQTYREECLLIVQLKNLSLVGFSWQGEGFKVIDLPRIDIEGFELAKITPIPKYGFLFGNKFVKVEASLRDLSRPVQNEMEKIFQMRNSLEEIFVKQEMILDETEKKLRNSYFVNPVVTGFWNISDVDAKKVTIPKNVSYNSLLVGKKSFTALDVHSDSTVFDEKFKKLDEKIEKISLISNIAVRTDAPEVYLNHGLSFAGGMTIGGTAKVKNLTLNSFNGFTIEDISNNLVKYDKETVIKGLKSFTSIEADLISVKKINGVPKEYIIFDNELKNYEQINFTHLNQLVVNGTLSFTNINGYPWDNLMKNVVWKNRPRIIPGTTFVYGEIVADSFVTLNLNGVKYPDEYVLQNSQGPVEISGEKIFDDIKVNNLKGIKRINGIPYEDFLTLNKEQTLPNRITFKNLAIDELLQIDGEITGVEINSKKDRLTLKDENVITADTMFMNLHVKGNIMVENSAKKRTLQDFNDIIFKTDEFGVITGEKTFLGNVEIDSKLIVSSKMYNGHLIDEYATLSGEQEFPNLRKISTPVTFAELKYKQSNDLENFLNEFVNPGKFSKCAKKKLVFKVDPVFEDISFRTLNGAYSAYDISEKFRQAFQIVNFENLEITNLYAADFIPKTINNVNFFDFNNRRISASKSQILTGNYTIKNLKAGILSAKRINGIPLNDFEKFRADFEDLFDRIWNGKMVIDVFMVGGRVRANKINGQLISEIYSRNEPRNVIVADGFYAKRLEVHGLVNGLNLTEFAWDSVLKRETDVIFAGEKAIEILDCELLQVSVLNGNPVEAILSPSLPQTLTGPILVRGNVEVTGYFSSDGRVNNIMYKDLLRRISYQPGNNTFKLHGDFRFPVSHVTIENLQTDSPILGITFNDFLNSVVFQDPDNLAEIRASKVFTNSVTFKQNFTLLNEFNRLNLTLFNEQAVTIDKDIRLGTDIIFANDLTLGNDLTVLNNLRANTISKVDINELKSNAIFLDRPSIVKGTLTFTNAIFESGMNVNYLNGVNLNNVILLRDDEIISSQLSFGNVVVEHLEITGTVNGYSIKEIFENTFTLFGEQIITGDIIFHGNVFMKSNFDPHFINQIGTSQLISLNESGKLNGKFEFLSPLILKKNLRVFGLVNNVDPATWEAEAVYDSFPKKQLVNGNWVIQGNVKFEKDVLGNGLLNGIDVRTLSDQLEKRNLIMDSVVTGIKMDLKSTCNDLVPLQKYARNQIYRFKFFDYFQILDFDVSVKSAHHFEATDGDYLMVNLERCFLNTFVYNGSGFALVSSVSDFDAVDKWITLKYENEIYLVTVGTGACEKSFGNLWKFEEKSLTHIFDLGNVKDVKKIGDYVFLVISEERLEKWSIEDISRRLYGNSTSHFSTNGNIHFVPNTDRILIVEDDYVHEFHRQYLNRTSLWNSFGSGMISALQAGIYRREMFLYYDEGISENNAFIFDGLSGRKIRQSIPIHNPSSFLIINFDGFVETFLTFIKNGRSIEIFEYKGIEGFVYRESIKMQIDNTFGFKLRKRSGLSKTNFFAAVHRNTLTIFEAKMYGEKLDVEYLICED